jgi:hypothetical protein
VGSPNETKENPAHGERGGSTGGQPVAFVTSENCRKDLVHAGLDYVLAEIRVASLRLRLALNEVEAVGLAVKAGLMSADVAIEHLYEIGAPLSLVGTPSERSV